MWEITIVGNVCDIIYFEELQDNLSDKFGKDIIVAVSYLDDLVCSIATVNSKIVDEIKFMVYETIIKSCKLEFFRNNLDILDDNKTINSYILSTLVSLDLTDEILFAIKNTRLHKKLIIRSFVNFELNYLIQVWKSLCEYINISLSGKKETVYISFLRFLAKNLKSSYDVIYLESNCKDIDILDKDRKRISRISKKDEIDLIVNLLMCSPQKLIINCYNELSNKLSELIRYIFEDKISVLL